MTDLSTYAGQTAHYAAVKARLGVSITRLVPRARVQPVVVCIEPPPPPPPQTMNVDRLADFHTQADRIIADVADKHGLAVADMIWGARAMKSVVARQECFFELNKQTNMSLPMIGRKFGGFDHTTVLHGIRKHAARLDGTPTRKTYKASREPVWGVGGWR